MSEGALEGVFEASSVGECVGTKEGAFDGDTVIVGTCVGALDGVFEASSVGECVGTKEGAFEGDNVVVGILVGDGEGVAMDAIRHVTEHVDRHRIQLYRVPHCKMVYKVSSVMMVHTVDPIDISRGPVSAQYTTIEEGVPYTPVDAFADTSI